MARFTIESTRGLAIGAGILVLASCGLPIVPTTGKDVPDPLRPKPDSPSVLGQGGFAIFGEDDKKGGAVGIGVNSFLWRASLNTLSFMPLVSADPFGGVIITDWYSPSTNPGERFKLTVFILDRRLRADGVRVSVFRQRRTAAGEWADAAVAGDTARAMENAILTGARQMRIAAIEQ
jgi:hypothetical protein